MADTLSQAGQYLVAYDLDSTHARRLRIMLLVSSATLLALGVAWAIYFGMQRDAMLLTVDLIMVAAGLAIGLLARQGRLRPASLLLALVVYGVLVVLCGLYDIPDDAAPRSLHTFFLVLAIGSHLLFRGERPMVRHGITFASFVGFVYFASTTVALIPGHALPASVRVGGTWMNNITVFVVLYLIMHTFIGDVTRMETYLHEANNRFVDLVRGMFPRSIAERLLTSGRSFAQRHDNCSVLFADIVSFTHLAEQMKPDALVDMLSTIFSRFDQLVEAQGLTKIKTIGDAYMVAAGVPDARPDHATALIAFGCEMLKVVREFEGIELRIGIASGDLVAGVIGKSRQVYDVWGDAVNMASRMESHGIAQRIQVSESTYQLARAQYAFDLREGIHIKGKTGSHTVYVLQLPAAT